MAWYVLALLSAAFSAAAAIVEKKILFKDDALDMSAALALINLVLCIPFFFMVEPGAITALGLAVLFFKSILGAISFFCIMKALKSLELSSALPLLAATPMFIAFFALIFLGETLSLPVTAGMLLVILGTYLLELRFGETLDRPFKAFIKADGHQYILYALALQTATSILDKVMLSKFKMPLNSFMAYQHLFFAIIFLAVFAIKKRDFRKISMPSWGWLLLLGVFTIIYRYSQIAAVKVAAVAVVISIKRISVLFASIIGGTLFKEKGLLWKSVATILIVGGALLLVSYGG